jgi:cyclic pyranopterin phosphate synthase
MARIDLPAALAAQLEHGEIVTAKGAVFHTAQLAGVLGTKRTSDLIPLCHPLRLDDAQVEVERTGPAEVTVHCRVRATERTGVEMEALTGAAVAALTLYDMTKSVSHGIVIRELRLLEKTGGKKDWRAPAEACGKRPAAKRTPRARRA